jgi:hydroxymethylpyrimidine kinase / phosphomethylpyrimidine kinase / thiamine-phosphate diphosphorylase
MISPELNKALAIAKTINDNMHKPNNMMTDSCNHNLNIKLSQNFTRPIVLTIAGSDSAGLAGIQMDTRTINALGGHTATCITANTAQNNQHVLQLNPVTPQALQSQLEAVNQFKIAAIKIGLVANAVQVLVICDFLDRLFAEKQINQNTIAVIYDPVLSSSSAIQLVNAKTLAAIKQHLIPRCSLITPNINEAEHLTGLNINHTQDRIKIAKKLHQLGAKNILIKGGHASGCYSQDYFSSLSHLSNKKTNLDKNAGEKSNTLPLYLQQKDHQFWLSSKRINTNNDRGTGCALSSSIACALALGYTLFDALVIAKMAINQGLKTSYCLDSDKGLVSDKGSVAIQFFPNQQDDLPYLTQDPEFDFEQQPYPQCNQKNLGLYPVVDSFSWLKIVIDAGVTIAQIRIKDTTPAAIETEIVNCIHYAKKHHCRLFINDYWQLAIKHQAYGVHLGQEDLQSADMQKIFDSGLRLGISTHCHYEVATAHSFKPSYIACGPVFHTDSKQMPWQPLGLIGLNYWRHTLNYPLVAIGGINQQQLASVAKTQVDAIAMISAITKAEAPTNTIQNFSRTIQNHSI